MKHKHRPCPCGCGDMADECMAPHAWRNPLGAFQIVERAAIPERDSRPCCRLCGEPGGDCPYVCC